MLFDRICTFKSFLMHLPHLVKLQNVLILFNIISDFNFRSEISYLEFEVKLKGAYHQQFLMLLSFKLEIVKLRNSPLLYKPLHSVLYNFFRHIKHSYIFLNIQGGNPSTCSRIIRITSY